MKAKKDKKIIHKCIFICWASNRFSIWHHWYCFIKMIILLEEWMVKKLSLKLSGHILEKLTCSSWQHHSFVLKHEKCFWNNWMAAIIAMTTQKWFWHSHYKLAGRAEAEKLSNIKVLILIYTKGRVRWLCIRVSSIFQVCLRNIFLLRCCDNNNKQCP